MKDNSKKIKDEKRGQRFLPLILSSLSSKGFTLVELLVVIGIIALLASYVFVQLESTRTRGRDAERERGMKSLQNALAIYVNSYAKYPPSNQNLFPYGPSTLTGSDPISLDLINSGTTPSIPKDPLSTGSYVFTYSSIDGSTYEVQYFLETDTIHGKEKANNPQRVTP